MGGQQGIDGADAVSGIQEPHRIWYRLRGRVFLPVVAFLIVCQYGEVENEFIVWPIGGALFAAGACSVCGHVQDSERR